MDGGKAEPEVRLSGSTSHGQQLIQLSSHRLRPPAAEMHARGLSARDIEDALCEATDDSPLSRSAVRELSETLWLGRPSRGLRRLLPARPVVFRGGGSVHRRRGRGVALVG
jgi:hypothetical protein